MSYHLTNLLASRVNELDGQSILITGGTGSFGQAFTRMLLEKYQPRKVVLLSRDEQKHYQLQQTLKDDRLRFFVGDIRDKDRLRRAFADVDYVFHAAAMKHVHIAEYNPIEAIRTNVDGAANVIDAAIECGVKRVVALSTDKAVNPVNLYGATKLCMEKLFVAANSYSGTNGPQFDLVRYGNVVGSKGSVVPLFLKQKENGKLTITEPTMTRFWIGMQRALDLVLLALSQGLGGEVFIPKLPACDVQTLAHAIAPNTEVTSIGIRPGEKMHETLITEDESLNVIEYDQYYVVRPNFSSWSSPERTDGKVCTQRFAYSSDVTYQLNVEETRDLLVQFGFLPA